MSADDLHDTDLLAAYADGALTGAERARVDALLASDAHARAEVDALRQVINATRAAQPRPSEEPAWDEMAASIREACGPAPRRRSIGAWLRQLLRPRFAAPIVAVAAAVALFVVWSGSPNQEPRGTETPVVALQPTPPTTDPLPGMRASEVEDLDHEELDALLATLGPESLDPDEPDEEDDAVDEPVLPEDVVTEWVLASFDGEGDAPADTTDTDLFSVPDYGTLLEDLSEDELSELDAYLAAQTG